MKGLDAILNAVELHRQRDALEDSLRGGLEIFDRMQSAPGDPLAATRLLGWFCQAKLLLADIDRLKETPQ